MPTRDHLRAVNYVSNDNGHVITYSLNRAAGDVQSISALNNAGTWKPNVFKATSVVMTKAQGSSAGTSGTVTYLGKTGTISGHLHARLAAAAMYTPAHANLHNAPGWDATAAAHSHQKAMANLNSADVDLGVMLGELSETIAGLANPFSALRKYVVLFNKLRRRGKRPKGSVTLNMLTGSWLEWWYGVFPIIRDIQNIIQHVSQQTVEFDGKLLRRGGRVYMPQVNRKINAIAGPGSFRLKGTVNVTVNTFYVTKVYFRRTRLLTFEEQYGLDAASLPSVLWELLPLSFVFDWFFSVGSWLKSLQTSDARSVVGSVTSQKSTIEVNVALNEVLYDNVKRVQVEGGGYHSSCLKLDRRVNQPLALTPLANRGALGIKNQITSLSLLWQRMPKLRR